MTAIQTSLLPNRTVDEFVEEIKLLTEEIQELYCLDEIPWIIGVSWGKDSSAVLQLVWNAISALPPEKRHKTIHVITTDTLVENPIVSAWVRKSIEIITKAAEVQKMPFQPHLLYPAVEDRFWSGLIGKGYPAPRLKFRWCTGRLKINASNNFIREVIRNSGETILILGIRKAESVNRAKVMNKLESKRLRERLSPNANMPNSLVYSPIEDWNTNEVWMYLMQWENPWGSNNKDLFAMYRGATADNECPLVIDTSTPSCGSSRFGCWVCTLVDKDTSLSMMIQNDDEKEWLQPLVELRAELDLLDDRERRDFRRLIGKVQLFERNLAGEVSIEPIPGPYTKQWRGYWLKRVLEAQVSVRQNAPDDMKDITLITPEELSEIRRIWLEEKHEFDDQLPKIYQQVTGETFQDLRPGVDNNLLGSDEWDTLADLCADDPMHLELLAKLLDTERQYFLKTQRKGIYKDLEKCFESSSRAKEEAIENAHYKRNLTNAASQGDISQIKNQLKDSFSKPEDDSQKQTTWASLKFPNPNAEDE